MDPLVFAQVPFAGTPGNNPAPDDTPYDPNDILNAFNLLIAGNNGAVAIGQQTAVLNHTMQNYVVTPANELISAQQTFLEQVNQQLQLVGGYQAIFDQNTAILAEQREANSAGTEQQNLLTDAVHSQGMVLDGIFRNLENMDNARMNAHLEELLQECTKLQFAGGGIDPTIKQKRDIAIVASFVAMAASTCLLFTPVTAAGAISLGFAMPGYKYARQSKLEGEHAFSTKKFLAHVAVGGSVNLVTSLVVGPALANLGKQIVATRAASAGANAIAATVVDTLLLEFLGKTISQAVLNTTGILLRKKLLGEKVSPNEVFYSVVAGCFGATASFAVDKAASHLLLDQYSDKIADTVMRIFSKGMVGFVNSAGAVWIDNLCNDRKWYEGLLHEGAEGFFWSLVYQAADELKLHRFKKEQFEKIKKEVIDEINSKQISEKLKKDLIAAINKVNSLEEMNAILNEAERKALIAEVEKKEIPPQQKEELINALQNKDLGLNETIKNVYTKQIQNSGLPQKLKDKLLDNISKAQNLEQIQNAVNDSLKDLQKEIDLGKLEGKTWQEVRDLVSDWVKEAVQAGYHPTGDHLPQHMWKDPIGQRNLVDRIMKYIESGKPEDKIIFTHHHHNRTVEVIGNRLVIYRDGDVLHSKDFEGNIVKPRDLELLRNNRNNLKSVSTLCDKIIKALREAKETPDTPPAAIKKIENALKNASVSGLSQKDLEKMFTALQKKINESKAAGKPPAKLNYFASPWIAMPLQQEPAQVERLQTVDLASIKAPVFEPRQVSAIRAVQAIQPVNVPVITPIALPPAPVPVPVPVPVPPPVLPVVEEPEPVLLPCQLTRPEISYVTEVSLNLQVEQSPLQIVRVVRENNALRRRQEHINRLEFQIAHCAAGKAGRAKKRSLQLQLTIFKNS